MDKKIFEVEISSSGPKGYETAAVLTMPCTQSEFRDALQRARIPDIRECKNELTKISYPGITSAMIGRDVDLLELNLLAIRLTMLSEDDRMGLEGLIQIEREHRGGPIPLPRFIDLTFHADTCLLAPQVSNAQELGALLYEGGMLSDEAIALLDTTEEDSDFRTELLELLGRKHQEDHSGTFTSRGYVEPGGDLKPVYKKGEMFCFALGGGAVVLEVSRCGFQESRPGQEPPVILKLPASYGSLEQALARVGAASVEECAFRCADGDIPSLRETINDTLAGEGGFELVHEFARQLAQKERIWDEADRIKYKALLSVAGRPSLQDAMELMHGLDEYELRPEVAQTWNYAELVLREKYPDLPEELFQTPQAARVGQRMLEENHAAITDYGLLRRTDRGQLPVFDQEPVGPVLGGM